MGCRYVLPIPGGNFVFRVPHFSEPPPTKVAEVDLQAVTFFFTSEIRFRNPDAVRAVLELPREVTRIPFRWSDDQVLVGQLDPPADFETEPEAAADRAWDVAENVRESARRLMIGAGERARNGLGAPFNAAGRGAGALAVRDRNIFLREAVRRYNGGREFQRHGGVLRIDPTTTWEPNIYYPDDVLNTAVPYQQLIRAPNQREPRAAERDPQVEFLDYLEDYHVPGV